MTTRKKPRNGGNRSRGKEFSTTDLTKFETVELSAIRPSPENDDIYGHTSTRDVELRRLASDIASHGVREPITLSSDGYIISGHRRFTAAKLAGLLAIPARRIALLRSDHSEIEWKRILAAYNQQRVKSAAQRVHESLLSIDPELAHRQLVSERIERDRDVPAEIAIRGELSRSPISAAKEPMLIAAIEAIDSLRNYWPLTVRQIHYRLLNTPPLRHSGKRDSTYANDRKSYQDLCDLLTRARLHGRVSWAAIADSTRPVSGLSYSLDAGQFIQRESHSFLRGYRRDLQQSQSDYVEIVAEKLTVRSILKSVADRYCVPLTIGRGYCSLQPRYELAARFKASGKDRLTLLVVSDLDPDGDCIAESFARSMRDDFGIKSRCIKALLSMSQVSDWRLPPNGLEAKKSSSSYAAYRQRYGTDQVYELEAIEPPRMQQALSDAIESVIDLTAFNSEITREKQDAVTLAAIKESVSEYLAEMDIGTDG